MLSKITNMGILYQRVSVQIDPIVFSGFYIFSGLSFQYLLLALISGTAHSYVNWMVPSQLHQLHRSIIPLSNLCPTVNHLQLKYLDCLYVAFVTYIAQQQGYLFVWLLCSYACYVCHYQAAPIVHTGCNMAIQS